MSNRLVNIVKMGNSNTIGTKVRDGTRIYAPKNLDGCVLYYPMDEKTINLSLDHSGHLNHGTIYGAVEADGYINKGLSFDGIDDWVDCGNVNNMGTGSLSLVAWFYANGDTTYGATLVGKQSNYNTGSVGYGLYYRQDSKCLVFNIGDGTNGAKVYLGTYNYNTWYFVVGVYNSVLKKSTLYVNGVKQGEAQNINVGNIDNTLHLRLGYSLVYYKGKLDEVRVYNRELSEAEIVATYQQEL